MGLGTDNTSFSLNRVCIADLTRFLPCLRSGLAFALLARTFNVSDTVLAGTLVLAGFLHFELLQAFYYSSLNYIEASMCL